MRKKLFRLFIISSLLIGCNQNKEHVRPIKAMQIPEPKLIREKPFAGITKEGTSKDFSFDTPGTLIEFLVDKQDIVKKGQTIARIHPITPSKRSILKAPFDGIVTDKFVNNYDFIQANEPLISITDQSHIEMVVDIPEHIIQYVPNVKEIIVKFDTLDSMRFQAKVKEIKKEASAATRAIPVILSIEQPEYLTILPNMTGEAKFSGEIKPESGQPEILLPIQAVFTGQNHYYVWVVNRATSCVHKRIIVFDSIENTGVHITKGLQPGEWVATAGLQYLNEGQKIRFLEPITN